MSESPRGMPERLDARQEIWRGLLFGQRSMLLRMTETLKRGFGLSVAQFEALLTLLEVGEPVPMARLARRLLYSSGSATHLVSGLERRGLVTRTPAERDARVVMVALTEEGQRLVIDAEARHRGEIEEVFAPLIPEEDVAVLLDFARRLAAYEGVTSQNEPGPE